MKEFNELISAAIDTITVEEKEFVETHYKIMESGQLVSKFAIELAKSLKHMKDSKLFKVAGFKTFEDYSESACGLKKAQAYNYIKVIENLPEEMSIQNRQIGVSKLIMLSRLSSDEIKEVESKVDLEETSTRELKEEIKKIKEENKQVSQEFEDYKQSTMSLQEEVTESKQDLEHQLQLAKKQLKELKTKPAETIIEKVEDTEALDKLKAENKKLEEKVKLVEEKEKEIEKLSKQLQMQSNESLLKFKLKFEQLQNLIGDIQSILSELDNDSKEKCNKALNALVGGLL